MEAGLKMALSSAGCVITVFYFLLCGYHHVQGSVREEAPDMSTPPLFNFGNKNGDSEIKDTSADKRLDLPFNISYFGSSYRQIHISPDGTIGFEKAAGYISGIKYSEGVRNPRTDTPFMAPFYYRAFRPHRIDPTDYQGNIFYRMIDSDKLDPTDTYYSEHRRMLKYLGPYLREAVVNAPKEFSPKLIVLVTWSNVADTNDMQGADCTKTSNCPSATFQAVIVSDQVNTFAIFNYDHIDMDVQDSYQSGFNGGHGRGWFNVIPCHGACDYKTNSLNSSRVADLAELEGSDHQGRYILNVGHEIIVRGGCLPSELYAGSLELYPHTVGMFGGEKLEVSGQCLPATNKIYCRFGDEVQKSIVTTGAMVNSMKGYCPVPFMTRKGPLSVYWSADGKNWVVLNSITVVLPSRLDSPVVIQAAWKEQWTSRDARTITVPWDPNSFSEETSAKVDIKLIGYRELPNQRKVEHKVLEHIGSPLNSDGKYNFEVEEHRCKSNCEDFEIGILEVSLPQDFHGSSVDRVAIRYGPIPLGWYVNEELEEDRGSDWSDQKCREWHSADSKNEKWMASLLPCPCSLDQALADFGRWQPDPGCNLYTGSQCHYHKGAKHCVRSIKPTFDGAGNQCCYEHDGTLRYSQLSYQGSTPDRSHVWGSSPYDAPDRVPSLSHWKHDVLSFYYCCLWNEYDLCDLYMEQRPTADCRNYDVPGIGFIRGDPHITTFDGQTYQFGGNGDYWLAKTIDGEARTLMIQGKFEPREASWDIGELKQTGSWKPKALTTLAVKTQASVIEISQGQEQALKPRGLDIRIENQRIFFLGKSSLWQDFEGFTIINNAENARSNRHDNFTILLTDINVGVNVVAANGLLHVIVAVPPSLKAKEGEEIKVEGLLGAYDGNADNDYRSRGGSVSSPGIEKRKIFDNFAWSWRQGSIPNDYKLFHFQKAAEKITDTGHLYFEYKDIPSDFTGAPNRDTVRQFCGDSKNCQWDFQITGDRDVAKATKEADIAFGYLKSSAYRVENCGLPAVGRMAKMSANNFSVGLEVRVTGCNAGYEFSGGQTYRCLRETLDEAKEEDRDDYGIMRVDERDKTKYILHWIPRPETVCSDESTGLAMEAIIGIVVGCVVGVILIIAVVILVLKKRKSGSSKTKEKPKAATRGSRTQDPASAEAMLTKVHDRSPVYKPSKEEVHLDVQHGSHV